MAKRRLGELCLRELLMKQHANSEHLADLIERLIRGGHIHIEGGVINELERASRYGQSLAIVAQGKIFEDEEEA